MAQGFPRAIFFIFSALFKRPARRVERSEAQSKHQGVSRIRMNARRLLTSAALRALILRKPIKQASTQDNLTQKIGCNCLLQPIFL